MENKSRIGFEEFQALKRTGWVVEGDEYRETTIMVAIDYSNNSRKEVPVIPEVRYAGSGANRTAITIFVPPQEVIDEIMK